MNCDFKEKEKKFLKAKENLKKSFVGLDDIIEKVFSGIEIWYYMPELLERPIIINLWGMTGTGKTDLVRKIAQELEVDDSYLEIQLNSNDKGWNDSIQDQIFYSNILSNSQGILLLDEIQRFRTIDLSGETVDNNKYDDIWMLLSDGKFSDSLKEKERLVDLLLSYEIELEKTSKKEEEKNKNDRYKTSLYEARSLKRQLDLEEPISEILEWSIDYKIDLIRCKMNYKSAIKEKVYNQLLIFICGNLDEVYQFSGDASEVNIDANILHEFSKKISILDIKRELGKKFKPEQIARFGNNHIIYSSLSKENFKHLIRKKLDEIKERVFKKFNIHIKFLDNIFTTLYKNGVYPSQGVRPLFSTINNLIENFIPNIIFKSLGMNNNDEILVEFDNNRNKIVGYIQDEKIEKDIDLHLEYLEKNISKDSFYLSSLHESGHAIAYALLFKLAPSQVIGNSVGSHNNGFVIPHGINSSKNNLLKNIQILLAGMVAEEIVLGEDFKSSGSRDDLKRATKIISKMVRQFNMDENVGIVVSSYHSDSSFYSTNLQNTNIRIEKYLQEAKEHTKNLISRNLNLLKNVFMKVIEVKRLLPEEFIRIVKPFISDIRTENSNYVLYNNEADVIMNYFDLEEEGE